ncbi:MAG: hypothetical protein IT238_12015 [Bacteroidia bacterium]|nr:hypothetical protein [Bacteroidia bacterium]MCZ2249598.1 hypothetical protein [Bacteroidia bacterium]
MKWKKLGQVFRMEEIHPLLKTHASNPLPVCLHGNIYRVFFSGRDDNNKSSVGFVDIDIITLKVVNLCNKPVLEYGAENSYFSHGISIGNMYSQKEIQYILFMGWNIRNNEHWRGDVGRIELVGKNTMILNSQMPYLTVDQEDKVSLSYPWVMFHNGVYKMWYGSTLSWTSENGEMIHVIKYATSTDGENWTKHGIAIPYEIGIAQAFSKPCVIIDNNNYHMWYSYRSGTGETYRIGYAQSRDGVNWNRKHNEVGITVSENGWDNEMICYPYVFDHEGKRYMLYNGNSYGKTGFGLAVLENE